jgi:predicted ATPase
MSPPGYDTSTDRPCAETAVVVTPTEDGPAFRQKLMAVHPHDVQAVLQTPHDTPAVPHPGRAASEGSTESQTAAHTAPLSTPPAPAIAIAAPPCWRSKLQSKLYCRTSQEAILRRNFETRCCASSFLLISGPSGTGKTRLAGTLAPLVGPGYFLRGQFDPRALPAPYAAFVTALTDFSDKVMARGPAEVKAVREAIETAVGREKGVLTSLIPSLARILGESSEATEKTVKKTEDGAQRFNFALRMSLRSIFSKEKPLVLFLDDLEHADRCSLDVLYSLATDHDSDGLVLIGACDDSVQADSYLAGRLRDMEDRGKTSICNIPLKNLSEADICSMLDDTLGLAHSDGLFLARITHAQTEGNMLYIVQFLSWLQMSGILSADPIAGRWLLDSSLANAEVIVCSCHKFLTDTMNKLPTQDQEVLKVAACLGPTFDESLIEIVLGTDVHDTVQDLVNRNLLGRTPSGALLQYENTSLQKAAYGLISEPERELFHLEIGRRIWRTLSSEDVDLSLYALLAQMNIGRSLIKRAQEQVAVATLCLHAGNRAAKASSFRIAGYYLEFGLYLLDDHRWRTDYDLLLALHYAAAEMMVCTGDTERMEELLEEILSHARTEGDKVQAYSIRMYSLSCSGRKGEALDLGVKVLMGLDEFFPRRMCLHRMITEYKSVHKLLRGKTDEQLLRIPNCTDESKLQALRVLSVMVLPCLIDRPKFTPFVLLKIMKITLQHGLSVLASCAFGTYGLLCIAAVGDATQASRFARLSLTLLDRYHAVEYLPRVYAAVYGCVWGWSNPIREVLAPLLKAHTIGLETGDIEFSGLCANLYCMYAMDAGVRLSEIEGRWKGFHEIMVSTRQEDLLHMAMPHVQMLHHYMGLSEDPLSAKGDLLDFDEYFKEVSKRGNVSTSTGIRSCRMMICYTFGDYEGASEFALDARELWLAPPSLERSTGFFFVALVCLQAVRDGRQVRKNLSGAKRALKLLKGWARRCPENFMEKVFLIEAELASIKKKNCVAYEKYVCAISLAQTNKFPQLAGMSCERMARHLFALGKTTEAQGFFEKACEFYRQWEAWGKVKHLEAEIASMELPSP